MYNITTIILVTALICTFVSVVTEVTKELGIFNKIPTALQVLITSIMVLEVLLFAFLSYSGIRLVWYYPVAAFFAAFVVSIICTHGWEYLMNIFKRYYNDDISRRNDNENNN